ncbi:hypothetical protein [Hasllibacter sp. MH4015]|uniref:hypothetical protein n=1 Tax=Hasllibacter sp. MH4015 TaxID=2854029 RepID=UPI001CD3F5CA|nr:hypothetical protein [Hasllibacter sp. MH4015]
MKKALLTTAIIASLGTAAAAQGIQPVATTTPGTDVTVGTQASAVINPLYIVAGVVVAGVIIAGASADGTN